MKNKVIGKYYDGSGHIELIGGKGTGGWFNFNGEEKDIKTVYVGLDYKYFEDVEDILLHEIAELVASLLRIRYNPTAKFSQGSDHYLFIADHPKFSEWMSRTHYVCYSCRKDLKKTWKEWNKKRKLKNENK